ncbi:hypothetical protein HKX48_002398 [Thoreauomyces humboldtii]|nr:hypothetical protein HKX48_002398 [Thoreauomyces humboldtii]
MTSASTLSPPSSSFHPPPTTEELAGALNFAPPRFPSRFRRPSNVSSNISDADRKSVARMLAERPPPESYESEGSSLLRQIGASLSHSTPLTSPATEQLISPFAGGRSPFRKARPASIKSNGSFDSQVTTYTSNVAPPRKPYNVEAMSSYQQSAPPSLRRSPSSTGSSRAVAPPPARIQEHVLTYLNTLYSANYEEQSSAILSTCHSRVVFQNPALYVSGTQDLIDVAKVLPGICSRVEFEARSASIYTTTYDAAPHTVVVEATISVIFKHLLVWRLFQFALGDSYTYRATHVISTDDRGRIVHHEEVISLKDFVSAVPIIGRLYALARPFLTALVGGRVGGILLRCLDGDPRRDLAYHVAPSSQRPLLLQQPLSQPALLHHHPQPYTQPYAYKQPYQHHPSSAVTYKPSPSLVTPSPSVVPYPISLSAESMVHMSAQGSYRSSPTPSVSAASEPLEERELVPLTSHRQRQSPHQTQQPQPQPQQQTAYQPPHVEVVRRKGWLW